MNRSRTLDGYRVQALVKGSAKRGSRKERAMYFTYDWVQDMQRQQLQESLISQELKGKRPGKVRSILERASSLVRSVAPGAILGEKAREIKTAA